MAESPPDKNKPASGKERSSGRSSRKSGQRSAGRAGKRSDRGRSSSAQSRREPPRTHSKSGEAARGGASRARRDLKGSAVDLPRWVIDDLTRVTPKERVSAALAELGAATSAMIEGRHKAALRAARRAKELAPRDATVRETLGLAAYRSGDWQTALQELRAFRRIAGEPVHLPVEMDVLRALHREDDVVKTWQELQRGQPSPAVLKEGLVVYASFLIDQGRIEEARQLTTPKQLRPNPFPADLRVWYVAARANALLGDEKAARQLRDAIVVADPAFPGLDDLDKVIARAVS